MLFSNLPKSYLNLVDLKALCSTRKFCDKINHAMYLVEQMLKVCKKPVISAGFGKDSMATAIIARAIDVNIPIICGDPPNPLSDREQHIQDSIDFFGGNILRVPYSWNVGAVLQGNIPYPDGLKIKVLSNWQKDNQIDGVILGVRMAESRTRMINCALRGEIYQVADKTWRCLPISRFTAEESLAVALYFDAPINKVYEKTKLVRSFEDIRDGTWWPHANCDGYGHDEWIHMYYPEHYEDYIRATIVSGKKVKDVCVF